MYIYNYRAFDLYQKPVISLAILGDERVNWRPDSYNYTIAGCEVSLKFPTVKLLDYEERWTELEASKYLSKINYTYLTTSCLLPLASCLSSLGN